MSFRIQIIPVLLIALALNGIYVFNYFNNLLDQKYMAPKRILHSEIEDFLLQREESERYDRTLPRKRIYKIDDENSEEMPELIKERGKRSQSANLEKSEQLLEQLEEAGAVVGVRVTEEAKPKKAKAKTANNAADVELDVEKVEENNSKEGEESEPKKVKKQMELKTEETVELEKVSLADVQTPTKTKKKTTQKTNETVAVEPETPPPTLEKVEVEKVKEKKVKKEEVAAPTTIIPEPEKVVVEETAKPEKKKKVAKEVESSSVPVPVPVVEVKEEVTTTPTAIIPEPEKVVVEEAARPEKKKKVVKEVESPATPVVEVSVKQEILEKNLPEVPTIINVPTDKPGAEVCPTGVECSEIGQAEVRIADWHVGSNNETVSKKGITKKKQPSLIENRVPLTDILN